MLYFSTEKNIIFTQVNISCVLKEKKENKKIKNVLRMSNLQRPVGKSVLFAADSWLNLEFTFPRIRHGEINYICHRP